MDDIGNLVYVVVFIIWFLYRVFGKGGKKPVKPQAPADQGYPDQHRRSGPSESTAPPLTFEDILRELTGTPVGPPEPEPEIVEEETGQGYPDEYYPEPEEETSFEVLEPVRPFEEPSKPAVRIPTLYGKGPLRYKEFSTKKETSSKAAREAVKMFRSKHGVRQAFLMKEIFDRKHF